MKKGDRHLLLKIHWIAKTRKVTVTNYGGPVLFTESREYASAIRRIEQVQECTGDSPRRPRTGDLGQSPVPRFVER